MPISDEVRRRLEALGGRGAHPGQPPPTTTTDDDGTPKLRPGDEDASPEELEKRLGFRERARREDERFRMATDSEFWLALCFRDAEDPARFCRATRIPADGRYIPGPKLADFAGRSLVQNARDRARALLASRSLNADGGETITDRLTSKPLPDPLADVTGEEGFEEECAEELTALAAAFAAPPDPAPSNVLDSPHSLVVVFPSRDAKDKFLADTGLDVLGDKYLDGHQAARTLKIHLGK
ncbi:hypothetical protein [Actinomadura litoris]|uniref:hypothetical protein n=1 Tax=Actinomadura litoris TaxID=2678616 RepID=UPI001FA8198A|nr:hypothetical protein [Actinomadura litoris]